jgi:uncharacterized protein (DUF488 family)
MGTIYTIGHSTHAAERFVELVRQHGVQVVVDTRSSPYSRYSPQFDREALKETVITAGLRYLWMGDAVGGRPKDEACYDGEGHVLYGRVAAQAEFQQAVARIERGAEEFKVVLLCSEEDPAHCHRRLLVSRVLMERGAEVLHVRGDGSVETDDEVARKSGKALVEAQAGLFGEIEEDAWRSTGVIGKPAAQSVIG